VAVGDGGLSLTLFDFADAVGNDITSTTSVVDANLQVIAAAAPLPAPWLLILPGLVFTVLKRRSREPGWSG